MEILRFGVVGDVMGATLGLARCDSVAALLPGRCNEAATSALSEREGLAGHHPHGAGTHDLAFADRQRAVGERERAAHAVDARARLDPVAGLAGLEEVDREAHGRALLVVVRVLLDRPAEREVRERREHATLDGAAVVHVTLLRPQPQRQLVRALAHVYRPDLLEKGPLVRVRHEAGGNVHGAGTLAAPPPGRAA